MAIYKKVVRTALGAAALATIPALVGMAPASVGAASRAGQGRVGPGTLVVAAGLGAPRARVTPDRYAPPPGGGNAPRPTPAPDNRVCARGFLDEGYNQIHVRAAQSVDVEFAAGSTGYLVDVTDANWRAPYDQHESGWVPPFGTWHYHGAMLVIGPGRDPTGVYTLNVTIPAGGDSSTLSAVWVARSTRAVNADRADLP